MLFKTRNVNISLRNKLLLEFFNKVVLGSGPLKEEEYYMVIKVAGHMSLDQLLPMGAPPVFAKKALIPAPISLCVYPPLTGVPLTAEHQASIAKLEMERGEISNKLSAVREERERDFMEKAATALGLNPQQAEQIKPALFRLLQKLSNFEGVDILRNAQAESKSNLLFTLFGGVVGVLLAGDAARSSRRSIATSQRSLFEFEDFVMKSLKLEGEAGRAQARQRIESFLAQEVKPEAAASYKALSTVKVFDPMHRLKTWLTSVFGGKEKLMSVLDSVHKDVDKAIPEVVASVISGDKAKTRMALEASGKRLAEKHGDAIAKLKAASQDLLSKPLGQIFDDSVVAGISAGAKLSSVIQ